MNEIGLSVRGMSSRGQVAPRRAPSSATIMLTVFVVYAVRVVHLSPGQIGVVAAAVIAALPLVGGRPVVRTGCLAVLFFIAGCAIVPANIVEMTMRQAATPGTLRGRVVAAFGFRIGPHATLVVAAPGAPLSLPWVLIRRVRRVSTVDEPAWPVRLRDSTTGRTAGRRNRQSGVRF